MWTFLFETLTEKMTSEGTGGACSSYARPDGSCESDGLSRASGERSSWDVNEANPADRTVGSYQ